MEKSPGSSERAIVVYSPRNRLIVSILLCMLIIVGFLFLIRLTYSDTFPESVSSPLLFLVIVNLVVLLFELVRLILLVGAVTFTIRRLISHEAALTIDAQGITIRDYFPLGQIWLSWADVAALYVRSSPSSYLYIRLKTLATFTIKYHPIQRLVFRWNPSNKDTPITIPSAFLAIPVPQILVQIRNNFDDKLNRYQISVHG
jgi:hypothetical protein